LRNTVFVGVGYLLPGYFRLSPDAIIIAHRVWIWPGGSIQNDGRTKPHYVAAA
jgi:hypothetical protein